MTRPVPQSFISAMILITKLIRYHHRCNKTKCSRKVREMILRYGRQGSEAWHVVVFVVLVFVVIVFLVVVFVVVIFIFVVFIAFVFVVGGWMYGHGGTGHLRGSHGLRKTKSSRMQLEVAAQRAPRLLVLYNSTGFSLYDGYGQQW